MRAFPSPRTTGVWWSEALSLPGAETKSWGRWTEGPGKAAPDLPPVPGALWTLPEGSAFPSQGSLTCLP